MAKVTILGSGAYTLAEVSSGLNAGANHYQSDNVTTVQALLEDPPILGGDFWLQRTAIIGGAKEFGNTESLLGYAFYFGGALAAGFSDKTLRYDDVTDGWVTKVTMPEARAFGGTFRLGDRAHYLAASNAAFLTTHRDYNVFVDVWTAKAPTAIARNQSQGGEINQFGIIATGNSATGDMANTDVYSGVTDSWTSATSLSQARSLISAMVYFDSLYTIVGNTSGSAINRVDRFDYQANIWTAKTFSPVAFNRHTGATLLGFHYTFGGALTTGSVLINDVYRYNPEGDIWNQRTDHPLAQLRGGTSASYHGYGYTMGGRTNAGFITTVYQYQSHTRYLMPQEMGITAGTLADLQIGANTQGLAQRADELPVEVSPDGGTTWRRGTTGVDGFGKHDQDMDTVIPAAGTKGLRTYLVRVGISAFSPQVGDIDWLLREPVPISQSHGKGGSIGGVGYVGAGNQSRSNAVYYTPLTDTWTTSVTLANRLDPQTFSLNDLMYDCNGFLGGSIVSLNRSTNHILQVFKAIATNPTLVWVGNANTLFGRGYMVGGAVNLAASVNSTATQQYTDSIDSWLLKAVSPTPINQTTTGILNGFLYQLAGFNGVRQNAIQEYDPGSDSWRSKTVFPEVSSEGSAVEINGRLLTHIGRTNSGIQPRVYEYLGLQDLWIQRRDMVAPSHSRASLRINNHGYLTQGILGAGTSTEIVQMMTEDHHLKVATTLRIRTNE